MSGDADNSAVMRAAVIQMSSQKDCKQNLQEAMAYLRAAAKEGARLSVLPENFLCFGREGFAELDAVREEFIEQLLTLAAELKMAIVAGAIPFPSPDRGEGASRYLSRSLLIGPEGKLLAQYDKIHLFDVDVADGHARYRESDTYDAGENVVCESVWGQRLGMSICYDLRFPLLYQALLSKGANILSVPSAFTEVTGKAHWETLIRARAIETQCFVLAANQVGDHGKGRRTWGQSMIVDPWGRVLAQCEGGPGFCVADLDLQDQSNIRASIPVSKHRQFF